MRADVVKTRNRFDQVDGDAKRLKIGRHLCVDLRQGGLDPRVRKDALLWEIEDKEEEYREIIGDRDTELGEINEAAGRELIKISQGLATVGDGAVGGLPYRIARSRHYADTFRDTQINLRARAIETWWSYGEFVKLRFEPALKFIASVGEDMEKLQSRLPILKQDLMQRSIALQTELVRDNLFHLE